MKHNIWTDITKRVNATGSGQLRTLEQVKLLWKNLKQKATKDHITLRFECQINCTSPGGGGALGEVPAAGGTNQDVIWDVANHDQERNPCGQLRQRGAGHTGGLAVSGSSAAPAAARTPQAPRRTPRRTPQAPAQDPAGRPDTPRPDTPPAPPPPPGAPPPPPRRPSPPGAPLCAMEAADNMDETEWKYHGEGNKSLVVSHVQMSRVLRLLKYSSEDAENAPQSSEEAFRQMENMVDFSNNVMSPLLGDKFVLVDSLLSSDEEEGEGVVRRWEGRPVCEASLCPTELSRTGLPVLPRDSVLGRILHVQLLDSLDIEGLFPLYRRVEQYLHRFPKERGRLQVDGPYDKAFLEKLHKCPAEDDGSIEYAVAKVQQYRVAMTAKDCSIMDSVRRQQRLDHRVVSAYLRDQPGPRPPLYPECTLLIHPVDGPYDKAFLEKLHKCPAEDDGSIEYAVAKVQQYRVAMTAKDCSIMVTLVPRRDEDGSERGAAFSFSASILDLDPKPQDSVRRQQRLDHRVVEDQVFQSSFHPQDREEALEGFWSAL
ncbi:hypothetical protein CRUP_012736 [Coryphaenoides rupestris]|nr:hypothetical protein CRUP_012736 [Coryphaenoides rupestris]